MYSRPLPKLSSFIASLALVLASGCSDETGDSRGPVGPSPAGTPSIGLGGATGSIAGSAAGAAGRFGGAAGVAAPGVAGRPAAGSGAAGIAAPVAAAGTGAAGRAAAAGTGVAGAGAPTGGASAGRGGATAGSAAGAMAQAGAASPTGTGMCCADGNCLCHGPEPTELTTRNGPFDTASFRIGSGTVYYPTDAEPPFAAVGICGGFLNTGPEMESWGPMYASHGIVTVIVTTTGADIPEIRATRLLEAIKELEQINGDMSSPLGGKLAGRYGTSGYSMGGGGTTLAAGQNSMLKTSVGLAPWGGDGSRVQVASLLLCGDADGVAPCSMADALYRSIPEATPKMKMTFRGATHFSWFGPGDAGRGESGAYALAFQKVFLEGDERWKKLLLGAPQNATVETNIE